MENMAMVIAGCLAIVVLFALARFSNREPAKDNPVDELVSHLNLSGRIEKMLCNGSIKTVSHLRKAISDDIQIPGIGEKGWQEIRSKLSRYEKEQKNRANEKTQEIRFFWVGILLLSSALGLAFWGFTQPVLSTHQVLIMRWLLPLASGFGASAFFGSLTARARGWIPGIAITATGGFGVWLVTFLAFQSVE